MTNGTVFIKKAKAKPFWFGNPVIYSGAIEKMDGSPAAGDLVEVRSHEGKRIGLGFYNPFSSYRVRLVWTIREGEPPDSLEALFVAQLSKSISYRKRLNLPSCVTTGYRAINSEGDGLSGLVVDVYDRTAVVVENALWVHVHRQTIESALRICLPQIERVVFRASRVAYAFEGIDHDAQAIQHKDFEGLEQWFLENNIWFTALVGRGQKTGFYLDQRDNRLLVQSISKGLLVLDAFCYTGAFGVYSALGGAKKVICIDSSTTAIEVANEHARRNGVHRTVTCKTGDALAFMKAERSSFDLIICDPAGLAPSAKDVEPAKRYYIKINETAMRALKKGGVLVTCCCSASVTREMFVEIIRDAGQRASRTVHILRISGAGLDHPINPSYPEGDYLKCVIAVCY